jgi:lipase ATG15
MMRMENELLQWDQANVIGPDVESRETLLQLAMMTSNAYATGPDKKAEWYDLGSDWNTVCFFLSEPNITV